MGKDTNTEVIMKMGKGKIARAIITSGWKMAVKSLDIRRGKIYLFWFRRTKQYDGVRLRLNLARVQ
jgi:hypothetical protein